MRGAGWGDCAVRGASGRLNRADTARHDCNDRGAVLRQSPGRAAGGRWHILVVRGVCRADRQAAAGRHSTGRRRPAAAWPAKRELLGTSMRATAGLAR